MRKTISLKSAAALITIAILATGIVAYALFSITVTMNFKLAVSYGLEIWNEAQTEQLATLDYTDFEKGEIQVFRCYLRNTGNSPVDVYWEGSGWAPEWAFQLDVPSGWIMGEPNYQTLGIGEQLLMQCQLTEISATVGVSYSASLTFSIAGS